MPLETFFLPLWILFLVGLVCFLTWRWIANVAKNFDELRKRQRSLRNRVADVARDIDEIKERLRSL